MLNGAVFGGHCKGMSAYFNIEPNGAFNCAAGPQETNLETRWWQGDLGPRPLIQLTSTTTKDKPCLIQRQTTTYEVGNIQINYKSGCKIEGSNPFPMRMETHWKHRNEICEKYIDYEVAQAGGYTKYNKGSPTQILNFKEYESAVGAVGFPV